MWEPIWVSRFHYWLFTGEVSRSCLHSSRTRRVRTLNVQWWYVLYELCVLVTEGCSDSRMRSQTWQGVSKWSRGKYWYIRRWYSDTEMVRECFGIYQSTEGLLDVIRHNYPSLIHCLWAFHILISAYLLYRCHCYNYYKTATVTFSTVTTTIILLCY